MIHWGRGAQKLLLERGDKPEKGALIQQWGVGGSTSCITLQFNQIHSVCGKGKVSFITLFLEPFELAMQDSHPSLYSTKTLYHLHISDPF